MLIINSITEFPNICQKPEDVYKLRDIDWLLEKFKDVPILGLVLALRNKDNLQNHSILEAHTNLGLSLVRGDSAVSRNDLIKAHERAAIFSTIKILGFA